MKIGEAHISISSPDFEHCDGFIYATQESLIALSQACKDAAKQNTVVTISAMNADGEGYDLQITPIDSDAAFFETVKASYLVSYE